MSPKLRYHHPSACIDWVNYNSILVFFGFYKLVSLTLKITHWSFNQSWLETLFKVQITLLIYISWEYRTPLVIDSKLSGAVSIKAKKKKKNTQEAWVWTRNLS